MKVKALNHIHQQVGSLSIERVMGTVFELADKEAGKAAAAGLVEILEPAKHQSVRDLKDMEIG